MHSVPWKNDLRAFLGLIAAAAGALDQRPHQCGASRAAAPAAADVQEAVEWLGGARLNISRAIMATAASRVRPLPDQQHLQELAG